MIIISGIFTSLFLMLVFSPGGLDYPMNIIIVLMYILAGASIHIITLIFCLVIFATIQFVIGYDYGYKRYPRFNEGVAAIILFFEMYLLVALELFANEGGLSLSSGMHIVSLSLMFVGVFNSVYGFLILARLVFRISAKELKIVFFNSLNICLLLNFAILSWDSQNIQTNIKSSYVIYFVLEVLIVNALAYLKLKKGSKAAA